jgi:hypothetical protein
VREKVSQSVRQRERARWRERERAGAKARGVAKTYTSHTVGCKQFSQHVQIHFFLAVFFFHFLFLFLAVFLYASCTFYVEVCDAHHKNKNTGRILYRVMRAPLSTCTNKHGGRIMYRILYRVMSTPHSTCSPRTRLTLLTCFTSA